MVQGRFGRGSVSEKDEEPAKQVDPKRCDGANGSLLRVAAERAAESCAAAVVDIEPDDDEADGGSDSVDSSAGDPWALTELKDDSPKWNELTTGQKIHRVCIQWIGKFVALLALLYFFVCSLDFLSSAFRLLGGRAAGSAFSDSTLLQNPIAGLMIGVLATVLVQSSSTSSSIIVTMVASGILEVQVAIPIIMGANIGTSVTNTVVSLAQSSDRNEFRRAFGGATVHDMFNWLTVFILLPLEVATGLIYHTTCAMVSMYSFDCKGGVKSANADMLQKITKPFTELIVQLDSKVIEGIAVGDEKYANASLLKKCRSEDDLPDLSNLTSDESLMSFLNSTQLRNSTSGEAFVKCSYLFDKFNLNDTVAGVILLVVSLVILCGCLILMVKLLNSALRGSMMTVIKRVINADLPGCFSYFTGYIAIFIGAGLTMVVQSSSVFTSALTPLVGIGVIQLERVYPLTLGSNIGTTTTGILASLAASSDRLKPAIQIALCHLCFNVFGILIFYPIPFMRLPIRLAKMMGNTTAKYRWFALFYIAVMFFILPMAVFGLSMAGMVVMSVVVCTVAFFCLVIVIINVLQKKRPNWLPKKLRNWDFLPYKWMHSLEPLDRVMKKICCCCSRKVDAPVVSPKEVEMNLIAKKDSSSDCSQTSSSLDALEDQRPMLTHTTSDASLLRVDCESGYVTRVNTPSGSPCISRLPSYVSFKVIPEVEEHEEEH